MISRSLALPLLISHLSKGIFEVIFLNAPICNRRFLFHVTTKQVQVPIQFPDSGLTISYPGSYSYLLSELTHIDVKIP
jgi:hypothetical protein